MNLRDQLIELFQQNDYEITEEHGGYGEEGWVDYGRRVVPEAAADLVIRFLATQNYVIAEEP